MNETSAMAIAKMLTIPLSTVKTANSIVIQ